MTPGRLVAGLVLLAASAAAWAQDAFQAGDARRALQEAARSGPEAAAAYLDGLLAEGAPRVRARHVEAAKAAMDSLPYEVAAPRTTRLLAEALKLDPSNKDGAWSAAMLLRRDVLSRSDAENGERFLRKLAEIYDKVADYHNDLGVLLLDAGRREDARTEFARAYEMAPSNTGAAYRAAFLDQQLASAEKDPARAERRYLDAIAVYDRLIQARQTEFYAHFYRASVLGFSLSRYDDARRGIDEGIRIAQRAPADADRERALNDLTELRGKIDRREANRTELRRIDRRLTVILWCLGGAAAGIAAFMLRFVRRLD